MSIILIVDEEFSEHNIEMQILSKKFPQIRVIETNYNFDGIEYKDLLDVIGILAQVHAKLNYERLKKMPNLKCISVYGGGYNNIDINYAFKEGIKISRVPNYCDHEVAEFVIMSIFMLSKKIDLVRKSFYKDAWGYLALEKSLRKEINKNWSYDALPKRIFGKTLFIIGYGNIGKAVAKKANGLGMRVFYYDELASENDEFATRVSFEEGLKEADFVSIHMPLTDRTRYLFDYNTFKQMKKESYIINTARGAIIKEEDLIRALDEHIIAGAALDVFENEPLPTTSKLLRMKNILSTPHCIYVSDESIITLKHHATENLIQMIEGKEPKGIVKR